MQKFDKSFKLEDIIKIRFPNKQTINIKQVTMECFYWSMRIFALINKLAFPWDLSLEILEIWLASRSAQTTDNSYRQIALPRTAEAKITLFNSWFAVVQPDGSNDVTLQTIRRYQTCGILFLRQMVISWPPAESCRGRHNLQKNSRKK